MVGRDVETERVAAEYPLFDAVARALGRRCDSRNDRQVEALAANVVGRGVADGVDELNLERRMAPSDFTQCADHDPRPFAEGDADSDQSTDFASGIVEHRFGGAQLNKDLLRVFDERGACQTRFCAGWPCSADHRTVFGPSVFEDLGLRRRALSHRTISRSASARQRPSGSNCFIAITAATAGPR